MRSPYKDDLDKLIDNFEISICLHTEGAIYFQGEDMLFKFYADDPNDPTYLIETIKYKNIKYENVYMEDRTDSIYNNCRDGKILFSPRETGTIYDFLKAVVHYVDIYA